MKCVVDVAYFPIQHEIIDSQYYYLITRCCVDVFCLLLSWKYSIFDMHIWMWIFTFFFSLYVVKLHSKLKLESKYSVINYTGPVNAVHYRQNQNAIDTDALRCNYGHSLKTTAVQSHLIPSSVNNVNSFTALQSFNYTKYNTFSLSQ